MVAHFETKTKRKFSGDGLVPSVIRFGDISDRDPGVGVVQGRISLTRCVLPSAAQAKCNLHSQSQVTRWPTSSTSASTRLLRACNRRSSTARSNLRCASGSSTLKLSNADLFFHAQHIILTGVRPPIHAEVLTRLRRATPGIRRQPLPSKLPSHRVPEPRSRYSCRGRVAFSLHRALYNADPKQSLQQEGRRRRRPALLHLGISCGPCCPCDVRRRWNAPVHRCSPRPPDAPPADGSRWQVFPRRLLEPDGREGELCMSLR